MAYYEIIKEGNEKLTAPNINVESLTDEVRDLITDMKSTLQREAPNGLGLAAPQIGVNLNIIVVKQTLDSKATNFHNKPVIAMINPVILEKSSKKMMFREGCLSVPEMYYDIERHKDIKVRYMNEDGRMETYRISGTDAVVVQHETDHLNGILISTSPDMKYAHPVPAPVVVETEIKEEETV